MEKEKEVLIVVHGNINITYNQTFLFLNIASLLVDHYEIYHNISTILYSTLKH